MKNMLLLSVIFLLFSCGQSSKKTHLMEPLLSKSKKLDTILSTVKTHLYESNTFLKRGIEVIGQREDIPFESKSLLDKQLFENLKGENVYRKIKDYYSEHFTEREISKIYEVLSDRKLISIKNKELSDLTPENYKKYQALTSKDQSYQQKEKLIDKYQQLTLLSDTGIQVATQIRNSILDVYSRITFDEKAPKFLREQTDKQLNQFSLQTRYMMTEALRYSFHKLDLSELEYLLSRYERSNIQKIYKQIPNALNYAYSSLAKEVTRN